ncbi:ABC transporter substrate-binding protein [Haladaptatus caseinilyticus]|uniref:ABC transporter substrate-binding protein n=1 Tax=Haladaptatus caseinilyticus TaxID=2993314 RepID=UPI00224ABE84|nr:ABC transporter substrate-binding protein [Haladaptatus caseinilyticus]
MADDYKHGGKSRRRILQSLGGAVGTASLAGCMGSLSGGGDSDGTTELRFWTSNVENDRKKVIKDLLKSFDSNSKSKVTMNAVKEDDLPTRISSARASGTLPTVADFGLSPMQKLGSSDLLSTKVADEVIANVGKDRFYQGALDLTKAPDGGHYAVPMYGWVEGMWYRKSVWEENGLKEPTTWDALLNAAKTLHKPDDNQYGIVIGTKKTAFARQCFTPFARSNDARVFDKNGKIVFDSKEMVEALDFYGKLAQYTPPGKDTWKTANNTYLNEQSHLIEYSTFIMGDVVEKGTKMVKDTNFAPYVENKRKSSFGQIVGLNHFTAASDEALKYGKELSSFLMEKDQYIKWLHMAPGGMNPVLKDVASSKAFKQNETLSAWGSTVEDVSAAFENIERFGYVDGKSFPKLGNITNKYLIAEAISRVTDGEDAKTVATEQAEKMRQAIKE